MGYFYYYLIFLLVFVVFFNKYVNMMIIFLFFIIFLKICYVNILIFYIIYNINKFWWGGLFTLTYDMNSLNSKKYRRFPVNKDTPFFPGKFLQKIKLMKNYKYFILNILLCNKPM